MTVIPTFFSRTCIATTTFLFLIAYLAAKTSSAIVTRREAQFQLMKRDQTTQIRLYSMSLFWVPPGEGEYVVRVTSSSARGRWLIWQDERFHYIFCTNETREAMCLAETEGRSLGLLTYNIDVTQETLAVGEKDPRLFHMSRHSHLKHMLSGLKLKRYRGKLVLSRGEGNRWEMSTYPARK